MRVYADQVLNTIIIEGVSQGPCADFQFVNDSGMIGAYRIGSQLYDFKGVPFTTILNYQGLSYALIDDLMSYLSSLTIPTFPLRFRTQYPVKLTEDLVSIDPVFLSNNVYNIDGQNF